MKDDIFAAECEHLFSCKEVIRGNIEKYTSKSKEMYDDTVETYGYYVDDNRELHGDIIVSKNMKDIYSEQLIKCKKSLDKPYFARVDFTIGEGKKEEEVCVYIGKRGILRDNRYVEVVDWRAPIAAAYYEYTVGETLADSEQYIGNEFAYRVEALVLKRSFDLDERGLQAYYDSDIAFNDQLLIKYLSKNKVNHLEEIIATIQKEQNEAIRHTPFENLIIQGVAGSGKTTILVHRISYILYNYPKYFQANGFCILGTNDALNDYISNGLPDVDVDYVKTMRMDEFLTSLLNNEWKENDTVHEVRKGQSFKGDMEFIKKLEGFLRGLRRRRIPSNGVVDKIFGRVMNTKTIEKEIQKESESINNSLNELQHKLNSRIQACLLRYRSYQLSQEKKKEYKNYFTKYKVRSITAIYKEFLLDLGESMKGEEVEGCIQAINKGRFDIYDINAMVFIYHYTKQKEKNEDYDQVLIDEAQEYGLAIYYVLKKCLDKCRYTIVGDVLQRLDDENGVTSWWDLQKEVFGMEAVAFKMLNKSYRNTIEIVEFSKRFLPSDMEKEYRMEAVIRHGDPVTCIEAISYEEAAGIIEGVVWQLQDTDYQTIGILCFHQNQIDSVKSRIWDMGNIAMDDGAFSNGINVFLISKAKGLEFDAVIIFEHGYENSSETMDYEKWSYVAATRAIHKLYVVK